MEQKNHQCCYAPLMRQGIDNFSIPRLFVIKQNKGDFRQTED
jgi:hypothetical protein